MTSLLAHRINKTLWSYLKSNSSKPKVPQERRTPKNIIYINLFQQIMHEISRVLY